MDPADQARYGVVPGTLSCVRDDAPKCSPKRSPKRDADERKQQGEFASWLSLQRSKGRKIPYCWHATEQEEFRSACEIQHIEHYVVYSSQQAIKLVETAATVCTTASL